MPDRAHIVLIQRLVEEVFNRANLAAVETVYAPTYLLNDLPTQVDDLKEAVATIHELIPGFRVTASDLVQEGDIVVAAWTIHSSTGEATGSQMPGVPERSWTGLRLFRIVNRRIVAEWANWAARERLRGGGLGSSPRLPGGGALG